MDLITPRSIDDWRRARGLLEEYEAGLGVDLCFQNFADELAHLDREYGPPGGVFYLAFVDAGLAGCVALRRLDARAGEMKRLYVRPGCRGRHVGRCLAQAILEAAARIGYERVVLDTLPTMTRARQLYESLGFLPIPPYCHNPIAGTAYLERNLRGV